MHLRSDRRFRFAVEPAVLWAAIAEVEHFPLWWPWLRRFDAVGLEPGDVWRCTVQPPLPYSLSFDVAIGEVDPGRRVTATVSGEIQGDASIDLQPSGSGACEVHLRSTLAPSSRVLQAIAMVARPVVAFGHDWVLDTGAQQLRDRLAALDP